MHKEIPPNKVKSATLNLWISQIVEAIHQHIDHDYGKDGSGTARLPVLAIYSVYRLLIPEIKRYDGKILAPLEAHTSPDSRARAFGDIEINNPDQSCFEAVEIKHEKPITPVMVKTAYRKIKNSNVERYYILTTYEPNTQDPDAVMREIEQYAALNRCQILINGVIPSLNYYLRMIDNPSKIIEVYTQILKAEHRRPNGIKREHLEVWQQICRNVLGMEQSNETI